MGEDFVKMMREVGVDIEGMAALVPLATALRDERKRRGISYADAAKALATTQKALKAIEAGEPGGIDGAVLARFAQWLGLADYLRRWAHAQPALAERIGLPAEFRAEGKAPAAGAQPFLPDLPLSGPPPKLLPAGHTFPISPGGDDGSFAGLELIKKLAEGDPALTEWVAQAFADIDDDDLEMFADEPAAPATYEFEITLRHVKPRTWRRFRVQNTITLAQLHDVVQAVMGWKDSHLHAWDIDGVRFERPYPNSDFEASDEPPEDERKCRLADFDLSEKDALFYEYDFGDGWEHRVVLKKILPSEPAAPPTCIKGARACPPEDCGGPWGFAEVLEALGDPAHERHEELVDWIGEFDAEKFDLAATNAHLAAIAKSWRPRRPRRGKGRR